MAMGEVLVTDLDQIPRGEGRMFLVDGKEIAVFHTQDGSAYAVQPYCPHRQGPLADGLLGGTSVVCPLHDRTFDLRTGCGLSHEKLNIEVYPTRVAGSQVVGRSGGNAGRGSSRLGYTQS